MPSSRSLGFGLLLAALFVFVGVAGPALAPYSPSESLDPAASSLRPPGTRLIVVRFSDGSARLADRADTEGTDVLLSRLGRVERWPADRLTSGDPSAGAAEQRHYLLGSDRLGRDVWSRLLTGARGPLLVAGLAAALSLVVGVALGSWAGLGGRVPDFLVQRTTDVFLAFPPLLLALAIVASTGPSDRAVVFVLAATSWMGTARLVRGELRALREREFIFAARGLGLSPMRLLVHHLLPNAMPPVRVDAALRLADLVLAEAALSFLGLGVQDSARSWGAQLAGGREEIFSAWWTTVPAGLAIALLALTFHLLAEGWRERSA